VVRALKGVELTREEQRILSNICKENHNGDQEESIVKAARELQGSANGAVYSLEWLNINGLLQFQGKIYVPWRFTQTDYSPLPQHPDCRIPRMLENTRTGVPELLVTSDV